MEQTASVDQLRITGAPAKSGLWLAEFGSWLEERGRGRLTISSYLYDVQVFARWYAQVNQASFEPGFLTSVDGRLWREHSLRVEGVRPSTWNRRRASLGLLAEFVGVVLVGVEKAEEAERAPRWLAGREFLRVLRQVELNFNGAGTLERRWLAARDGALVAVMGLAGLREGEAADLEVGEVEIGERSGRVVVRLGKGEKRRVVPLGKEARRWVQVWLGLRGEAGGALFLSTAGGGAVTGRTIQRRMGELGRQCGVALTPHVLRHTFAKRSLDGGAALTVVQSLLGHKRLETTARYVQPGWEDLEKAVEGL